MPKLIDLTGKVFDKLTVLEKAPSRARHVYWKCQCQCGNIIEVSAESLKRNIPHDCGCVKLQLQKEKEQAKEDKLNHLIGKRFGKLVVENRTNKRINGSIVWKCKCDCGKYKNVPTHLLTSNHTQSCGCLIRESRSIDLTGKKFGKLTVLGPCDYKKSSTLIWKCKCECGNLCEIEGYSLRAGKTQSCGCINYSIGEQNIINILKLNKIKFKKEQTFQDLLSENNVKLRYDFAIIENNKIIRLIEFDGQQHYEKRSGNWEKDPLIKRQQRDKIKNEYAKNHNIPLVRIPYWERDNITLEMLLGDKYLIS